MRDNGIWFDEGALKLELPAALEKKLAKYIDKDICFGIRPEDIDEADSPQGMNGKAEASMLVDIVEPMGNELVLYLSTGKNSLVARLNS